jgi:hypothetical protein
MANILRGRGLQLVVAIATAVWFVIWIPSGRSSETLVAPLDILDLLHPTILAVIFVLNLFKPRAMAMVGIIYFVGYGIWLTISLAREAGGLDFHAQAALLLIAIPYVITAAVLAVSYITLAGRARRGLI